MVSPGTLKLTKGDEDVGDSIGSGSASSEGLAIDPSGTHSSQDPSVVLQTPTGDSCVGTQSSATLKVGCRLKSDWLSVSTTSMSAGIAAGKTHASDASVLVLLIGISTQVVFSMGNDCGAHGSQEPVSSVGHHPLPLPEPARLTFSGRAGGRGEQSERTSPP
mmetsp:Transcript_35907/g.85164  ORF Transcript_35907/g.85164 Transcript_35907/m.85164 type:complete len:162 (+) Transcript_35907:386-871(+)